VFEMVIKLTKVSNLSSTPVEAFYPAAEVLPDGHWKVVIIQLVDLFQKLWIKLLKLQPLTHFCDSVGWEVKINEDKSLVNNGPQWIAYCIIKFYLQKTEDSRYANCTKHFLSRWDFNLSTGHFEVFVLCVSNLVATNIFAKTFCKKDM